MAETELSKDIIARARKIKLLLMDCDGVLTDGRLYFSDRGEELKVFNVRDGQGLAMWHDAGLRSGIISGRDAGSIIAKRAAELGVDFVKVKSLDKAKDFAKIIADAGVTTEETAFIGDDVGDLVLLNIVGLPIAVGDAIEEVREIAAFVTHANGGYGAVREIIDILLKSKRQPS